MKLKMIKAELQARRPSLQTTDAFLFSRLLKSLSQIPLLPRKIYKEESCFSILLTQSRVLPPNQLGSSHLLEAFLLEFLITLKSSATVLLSFHQPLLGEKLIVTPPLSYSVTITSLTTNPKQESLRLSLHPLEALLKFPLIPVVIPLLLLSNLPYLSRLSLAVISATISLLLDKRNS